MLNTTKKKVGAVVLCGALVAAIGTGAVFAASSMNSLQVKMENGVRSYSTDGGKTWSQNTPEGVTVSDQDGKLTISNGTPLKDGEGTGVLCKVENGVTLYSTDGGKTWSEKAPAGAEESSTIGQNGEITNTVGVPTGNSNAISLQIKEVNGVKSYSTDGGKTWSQNTPAGVTADSDGKVTYSNGTPSKDDEGKGVLCKVENGVRSYSTDGGKTWSEKAPAGAEENSTIGND
ncbi:MAG: sialidase family protein [Dehalobacterium sp.]